MVFTGRVRLGWGINDLAGQDVNFKGLKQVLDLFVGTGYKGGGKVVSDEDFLICHSEEQRDEESLRNM